MADAAGGQPPAAQVRRLTPSRGAVRVSYAQTIATDRIISASSHGDGHADDEQQNWGSTLVRAPITNEVIDATRHGTVAR